MMKPVIRIGLIALLAATGAATAQNRFDIARGSTTRVVTAAPTIVAPAVPAHAPVPAPLPGIGIGIGIDRTPVSAPATSPVAQTTTVRTGAPTRIATRVIRVDRRGPATSDAHVNYWDPARWTIVGRRFVKTTRRR